MIQIVPNGKPATAGVGISMSSDGMIKLITPTDSWNLCKLQENEIGHLELKLIEDIKDPLIATDEDGRILTC